MNITAINYAGPNCAGSPKSILPYFSKHAAGVIDDESGPYVAGNNFVQIVLPNGIATNGYYLWLQADDGKAYAIGIYVDNGIPIPIVDQIASTPPAAASSYVSLRSSNGFSYPLSLIVDGGVVTTNVGQSPIIVAAVSISLISSDGVTRSLALYTDNAVTSLTIV